MGKIFIPVAFLMGVPASECYLVANLVAIKTIVNEFAAYGKLSEYIAQGTISVIHLKFFNTISKYLFFEKMNFFLLYIKSILNL